jgi:hypothetical protein
MQNTWSWKPVRENREVPIPCASSLTAAENEPPQSPHSLPEDTDVGYLSPTRPWQNCPRKRCDAALVDDGPNVLPRVNG